MKKFTNNLLLIIFSLILLSSALYAKDNEMKPDKKPMMQERPMAEFINSLTDEQRDNIQNIKNDYAKKNIDIKADMEKMELDFHDMMNNDNPSEKGLLNLVEKIGDLKTEIKKNQIKMTFDIRDLLTEEQREMMKKMPMHHFFEDQKPRMKEHMNNKMEK